MVALSANIPTVGQYTTVGAYPKMSFCLTVPSPFLPVDTTTTMKFQGWTAKSFVAPTQPANNNVGCSIAVIFIVLYVDTVNDTIRQLNRNKTAIHAALCENNAAT